MSTGAGGAARKQKRAPTGGESPPTQARAGKHSVAAAAKASPPAAAHPPPSRSAAARLWRTSPVAVALQHTHQGRGGGPPAHGGAPARPLARPSTHPPAAHSPAPASALPRPGQGRERRQRAPPSPCASSPFLCPLPSNLCSQPSVAAQGLPRRGRGASPVQRQAGRGAAHTHRHGRGRRRSGKANHPPENAESTPHKDKAE